MPDNAPKSVRTEHARSTGRRARPAPLLLLVLALGAIVLTAGVVVLLRLSLPQLTPLPVLRQDGVLAPQDGPSGLGWSLAAPTAPKGEAVVLQPDLFIEDPDMLESTAARTDFITAQTRIAAMLAQAGNEELLLTGPSGESRKVAVLPQTPLSALPGVFWVQLLAGSSTLIVAAVLLLLRPGGADQGAGRQGLAGFGLAGLGVAGSAFSAAIYSTRSLFIPPDLLEWLTLVNQLGTFGFGVGMIWLFSQYPRRLIPLWPVFALAGFSMLYEMAGRSGLVDYELVRLQTLVGVMFLLILALVAAQHRATRGRPADRAALLWLGLSVILGSGIFVLLVALPAALDRPALMSQGMAFIPLAAIYIGTALALARWRLFDLDRWALRLFLYLGVVALIAAVDALLLLLVSLSTPVSLVSSIALVGMIYLPLRDRVIDRWLARRQPDLATLHAGAVSVALQLDAPARTAAWRALMQRLFRPLEISTLSVDAPVGPALEEEGLALLVPGPAGAAPLRLTWAETGRRLFDQGDLRLVRQLADLAATTAQDRAALETALASERLRIARDLHDDVGSRLLSSLHSRDEDQRKDFLIEALADLRQIATGLAGREVTLSALLGEMRAESRTRAEALGRQLVWPAGRADDAEHLVLPYDLLRNFTALHREALSNALHHGGDGPIEVATDWDGARLTHRLTNPQGTASPRPATNRGQGLANMAARVAAMGGSLTSGTDAGHFIVMADLPLPLPDMGGAGATANRLASAS